jgi:hypothetical protein
VHAAPVLSDLFFTGEGAFAAAIMLGAVPVNNVNNRKHAADVTARESELFPGSSCKQQEKKQQVSESGA